MAIYEEVLLLFIACVVAIIARMMHVPYTVGLVLVGYALAATGLAPSLHLSHDLVFQILLPPLIFEAAIHLKWKDLKPVASVVGVLATGGVLVAAIVATAVITLLTDLPWQTALVLGVVLAPTDPVSVLALLKESALPPKVYKLVEAESLFNDGTASVLFSLIPLILLGHASPLGVASLSLISIGGGIGVGLALGKTLLVLASRTKEHLVEIAITVVGAFGSFLLAEHLHVSGVLATLTAGMVLANLDLRGALTDKGKESAHSFWEFAVFLVNSLIFLLIGFDVSTFPATNNALMWLISVTILATLTGRAVAVYGGSLPFRGSRNTVPLAVQNLLFWGGLRGALSIALVLGMPANTPNRDLLVSIVFHTVAFSIVVQGISVSPFLRRITSDSSERWPRT
jgi:CPA1 family monovalent cation:H+ antiporter